MNPMIVVSGQLFDRDVHLEALHLKVSELK